MAHPPTSAPAAPSKKRKRTPTTSAIPKPPTTTRTAAPTAAHFARLTAIWELDRRIPSPASRAAWAAARGLDVEKVHKWWYRCRARAKKMGIEIPEGSYEMEVGDVEAEVERKEKDKRGRVRAKKEVVEDVGMRKGEEEDDDEKGKNDTANVTMPPQTAPVPMSLPPAQVLMAVDEAMETSGDDAADIPSPSTTPHPPPTLPSSPIGSSSPLTFSQCFLPPSSPYTSPPPRSAPSPHASPPIDLPRLTRASQRLYTLALDPVPPYDSTKPAPLGEGISTLTSESSPVQPLTERRTSQIENVLRVWVPKTKGPKPPAKQAKKPAHRPVKTMILVPQSSKPSRKRSKTTRPPAAAPRTASRSLPAPPLSPARSRAPADIEIDDPLPTAAALEHALYEGITFERVDISLSAVPYIFGLDACGFQFGFVGGSVSLGSELGDTDVNAPDGDTARATAAPAAKVNDSATVDG
ncbi:hypothetical protein D9611_012836 [Ephemerocybe angulata]|uniref:Homeobox domain-containing protein n=1 Tax=Ephemerocybe angulata TaxID=980116 RepID=A0A8H5F143_9AGAR|nr:hypothetical protein D9611_012836 [Tulosesus angulatus]